MNMTKTDSPFKPLTGSKFSFRCHKEIPCFTKCCADLNLVLTPYDVVRMKNRLKLSSHEFLERYTETRMNHRSRFPMIHLKMNSGKNRTCPFVTPAGCRIYEDRPGACRIYPLGRAALKVDMEQDAREKFFLVAEKHCLGFLEDKEWTLEEWIKNEGLDEYNAMNDQWLEIVTSSKGLGTEKDVPRKMQMFFMASYNLDKFREFIFKSKFFERFTVTSALKAKLAADDEELMKFAFDWLKFSLFGERTIQIRS
jgi:Fe-S-cluster containining protein